MVEVVRQAIDPQHQHRAKPFAVWVGGPSDGSAKDFTVEELKHGHYHKMEYGRVGRSIVPIEYLYPIREVVDAQGKRGWRVYYLERYKNRKDL